MEQYPLLQTKLYIPPVRPELVSRPRLIERLNAGLPTLGSFPRTRDAFSRALTLISAPAGFGKTTLVNEWVHTVGAQHAAPQVAWLSLDEGDNDPARFLAYVIAALRTLALSLDGTSRVEGVKARQKPAGTIGAEALGILQSPGVADATTPTPVEAVLTSLINEIATLPGSILLVLDDYHLIEAQPIHDALTFLLEHLPPQMHLVIATREDPPLPFARLRARGQLTELRATDLRFSPSEAAEFLNRVMGLDLSAEDVTALESRTEGWIAGLQLAALALQGLARQGFALHGRATQRTTSTEGQQGASSLVNSFTGSHRFVLDYLIEEVLEQQSESIQIFLLRTSILDRLCGPLCEAVCFGSAETANHSNGAARSEGAASSSGTAVLRRGSDRHSTPFASGQETLEYIEQANLFIVPLDNERRWYRYHHLFADLLQQRLRQTHPEQIPTLHSRASEWYEKKDLPSDAIRHAIAAKDFERAAALAELAWPAWSGGFQSIMWLGWVKELPDELVRARPVLSLGYAWAHLNAGELEAAEARLLDIERWLEPAVDMNERAQVPSGETCPEATPEQVEGRSRRMVVVDEEQFRSLPASLASARAYHAQAIGDLAGTVEYIQWVLDLIPEVDHHEHGAATTLLALTHWAGGDLTAALQAFSDGMAIVDPLDAITGAFVLAEINATLGHLHEAVSTCEHALQLATEHGEPMPIGTEDVYTGISELHRERGDLEAAAQDLATAKKLGEQIELPDWQYRWCIAQARLNETRGDLDGALDLLDEAERLYVRTPLPQVRPIAAMKARVWVRQGRLAEAQGWARERSLSANDNLSYLREFEHITLARVLIAQYRTDLADSSIHEAMGLLERLLQAAEEGKRTGSVIEILVLQALADAAQGDIPHAPDPLERALVSLERALTLAEPEGYLRLFVDEGPPMARLLHAAAARGMMPDYTAKLLAAFEDATKDEGQRTKKKSPSLVLRPSSMVEPLSEREIEVLQLVAAGLTNREIASRLFLSLNTVKAHNRNIYGKLGVSSRTQAVARARGLRILPAT